MNIRRYTPEEARTRKLAAAAERRQWYRAHDICYQCGQRKAEPDRYFCSECLSRQRLSDWSWRKHDRESYNAYHRKYSAMRRARRKADGLCILCGKRPPEEGKRNCRECLDRQKVRDKERRRRKREGLLSQRPPADGR